MKVEYEGGDQGGDEGGDQGGDEGGDGNGNGNDGDPDPDPCVGDPNADVCEPIDPCVGDPNADGCEPIDPCVGDPNSDNDGISCEDVGTISDMRADTPSIAGSPNRPPCQNTVTEILSNGQDKSVTIQRDETCIDSDDHTWNGKVCYGPDKGHVTTQVENARMIHTRNDDAQDYLWAMFDLHSKDPQEFKDPEEPEPEEPEPEEPEPEEPEPPVIS